MKTKSTLLVSLSLMFISFMASAQVDTTGLLAYYPFNGNANDSSSYANNGVVYGAIPTTDRFGNSNGAYLFDGFSTYIEIPSSASLEKPGTTNQITMSAWVYLKGASLVSVPFCPVMQKTNSAEDAFMYRMGIDTGYSALYSTYNTDQVNYLGTYRFSLEKWYFLTTTFNGSEVKSYVDGNLISTSSTNTTILTDNHSLNIGRDPQGSSEYFNGAIDDISIYDRALSDNEVQVLYSGSVLPLTLTKFTAAYETNSKVALGWNTTNETNIDRFVVERSDNGVSFYEISTVLSKNGITNQYNFYDYNAVSTTGNVLYYRLKQVDKEGHSSYSLILPVKLESATKVEIYPNPVSLRATLILQSTKADNIQVSVLNLDGKIVLSQKYEIPSGNVSLPLNLASLAKGIYMVTINGKNIKQHISFTKE